jgi:hypothetical protein
MTSNEPRTDDGPRTDDEPRTDDGPRKPHYYDLLGVSPLVFALRTLVILVIALLVWWLTRLPEPLIALAAIVVWTGCNAFKDVKDWLTL